MKHYKKRTIALCLASVLTVVGAFGAENYINSLMGLKINSGTNGYVNVTAYTKQQLDKPLHLIKLDNDTYTFSLSDTNSEIAVPDISRYDNIESIDILTLPYTVEHDGYTKIVIRTKGSPVVRAEAAVYLPENTSEEPQKPKQTSYWDAHSQDNNSDDDAETGQNQPVQQQQAQNSEQDKTANDFVLSDYDNQQNEGSPFEYSIAGICILLLFLIIGFIYVISRDRMASIVGDQKNNDINNDSGKNKKTKKQIRKTINKLDKTYKNQSNLSSVNIVTGASNVPEKEIAQQAQKENESLIVDLDALYQEKNQETDASEQSETDDLAEFLSSFTFEEEIEKAEAVKEDDLIQPFNEELFNEIIQDDNIIFTESDIKKLNELAQNEISEEAIEYLERLGAERNNKLPTKEQMLEDLLSTYSIAQNIEFTKDDVDALKKIMSVELDRDFITDLTTNPIRTKIVEKEILEKNKIKSHKSSEIITLHVKDLLPDLSQELLKQGKKEIKSEVKKEVVSFVPGYEYTKLSVHSQLPDINVALKTAEATKHKPSYEIPVLDSGYNVSKLKIGTDELPDMADVRANPKKYEDKKNPRPEVDENALLNSLSHVAVKPIYEENEESENLLIPNEELNPDIELVAELDIGIDKQEENIIPIESDIEQESAEISNDIPEETKLSSNTETVQIPENKDFYKMLQDKTKEVLKQEYCNELQNPDITKKKYHSERYNADTENLLKLIEEQKTERELKKQIAEDNEFFKKELAAPSEETELQKNEQEKVITQKEESTENIEKNDLKEEESSARKIKNRTYHSYPAINFAKCNSESECILVQTEDGYSVVGNINDKQVELKHYDKLKSTNLQIRLHDKLDKALYLVKIGINKFIIRVTSDNMEFVMDLC